jgi:histidine triad (HIT) family protein
MRGGMPDPSCLFCKICAGTMQAERIHEDEHTVAIRDINPAAPTHVLVLPRKHVATLADLGEEDDALVAHMHRTVRTVAGAAGLKDFRVAINCGAGAGQSVFHLHFHVLGGRALAWPPG